MKFKKYLKYKDITEHLSQSKSIEFMYLTNQLNEGISVDDMKKSIKSVLRDINDFTIISRVFFVLNEKKFENMLNNHLLNFDLLKSPGLFDSVMAIISKSNFEDVELFMNDLVAGTIIKNISSLTKLKPTNLLKLCDSKHTTILEKLFPKLMEAKLSNTIVGPGEVLLTFLSPDVSKANVGDLQINGNEIEVKSTQARLESAMYGYGSAPTLLIKLRTDLETLGYFVKTKTGFSYTTQELKQLNEHFLKNPEDIKKMAKLLEDTLEGIMKNGHGTKLWSKVFNGKKIDEFNYIKYAHAEYFELYKGADGFKGILFINKKTYSSIYIERGEDLFKNAGYFTLGGGPSYDKRNSAGVPQLSLKI